MKRTLRSTREPGWCRPPVIGRASRTPLVHAASLAGSNITAATRERGLAIGTSTVTSIISKESPLERPPFPSHPPPLHEHAQILADPVRQDESPRILFLLQFGNRLRLVPDERMFGGPQSEKKLRLAVEEER